ncbi:ATP-grasp domain-containing protein [Agromyces archimandritae]|uniref:Alpha-L-glutamate ligase n=1 Tax=Agromyces archimandritae TaxID=2781962 RepID=A0A975IMI1_9MICO|nr:alpha-L-glutamate ligase [Agromyces archimandritae]QTX03518.1 alpha-L-glutamate ligase [Agromyces archimandritae]
MTEPAVIVLHDNADWLPPFERAFAAEGVRLEPWHLGERTIPLGEAPADAVFWSRLSASAHTRGVPHAFDTASAVLAWAEAAGRRVVNGSPVAALEVSKVRQYARLAAAGFDVPRTIAVAGTAGLAEAARAFDGPFITKHNRGGKGLGVRRFESADELAAAVDAGLLEHPLDGITLLQELLIAPEPFVTRAEFIGGRFHYAVRVDTSTGFELCPAEACAVPGDGPAEPLFRVRPEITAEHPLIRRLETFLAAQGAEIAGVEFFETVDGRTVPYDVNTNTNYSPDVEASVALPAATAIARFLGGLARASTARAA